MEKLRSFAFVGDYSAVTAFNGINNAEFFAIDFKEEKRDKTVDSTDIYSSDLNFWGLPSIKLISHFIETPFDLLINFRSEPNLALDYLCAKSVARFKVSRYDVYGLYDLVIDKQDMTDSSYVEEIIKTINNFS